MPAPINVLGGRWSKDRNWTVEGTGGALVDHVVINVLYDMDSAVDRFGRLGFTLTPRGRHSLGSINHLMVFGSDYLELVGVERDAPVIRREIAEGSPGLNGLVFRTHDATRCYQQLTEGGYECAAPVEFERPLQLGDTQQFARFRTVRLKPANDDGRIYFCEHLTPELVWRPEWQTHRNGAHSLSEFVFVAPDPGLASGLLARTLGARARDVAADESEVALGPMTIRHMGLARYRQRYGDAACEPGGRSTFMGAVTVFTSAVAKARECLELMGGSFVFDRSRRRLTVPAHFAFNAVLEFIEEQ